MRRPGFYFHQTDEDPQRSKGQVALLESDGFVCAHCQQAVFVPPRCDPADVVGFCRLCGGNDYLSGLICPRCVTIGTCKPFEKKLEQVEAGKRLWSDVWR